MSQSLSINFLDFSLSLSETLDLASPLLAQHQLRTAYIAWRIGEEYKLSTSALEQILFAALLHDIGAMTPEEKIDIHEHNYEKNIHAHCIYGEKTLNQAHIFKGPAKIVRYHHTEWQEWEQTEPTEIAVLSQIVFLADTVERSINREQFILHQDDGLVKQITELSGTSYYPDIVEAFRLVASREEFWLDCVSPSLLFVLRENAPGKERKINQSDFLEVSEVVRKIIDFRSSFTATHSTGVSSSAALIAENMGYSENEMEMMQFAGNLHDVGKMAVSNRILEKPARLTRQEYALIKQHTYHTCSFMQRCGLPKYLIEWAGYHHEKLNGTGYPYHIDEREISVGARIVAVADVLIALAEDKPYRKGLQRKDALSILEDLVQAEHLDSKIVNVLKTRYDEIVGPTLNKQKISAEQFAEEIEIYAPNY